MKWIDWTKDKKGRSNNSKLYRYLVNEVEYLMASEAHSLMCGNKHSVARLIVSQLAHKHKLAPIEKMKKGGKDG